MNEDGSMARLPELIDIEEIRYENNFNRGFDCVSNDA